VTVRATFKVTRIERAMGQRDTDRTNERGARVYEPAEIQTVVMAPVYNPDWEHENKKVWDASPTGEIRLGVINQQVWSAFLLDREYDIDFTLAE
jgi:hypothetical protein